MRNIANCLTLPNKRQRNSQTKVGGDVRAIVGQSIKTTCTITYQNFIANYYDDGAYIKTDWQQISLVHCIGTLVIRWLVLLLFITVILQWARWRLKSPALRRFAQPFVQAQIKENVKTPRHWPFWGECTSEFPSQKDSDMENVSIWWRHHVVDGCRLLMILVLVVLPGQ